MSGTILITGGAGFIGSNFVPYFCEKYPQYKVINLDKLTYAGNLDNLRECEKMSNYTFVQGDICDTELKLITGLILGDLQKPDPARPSLVLCSAGDKSMWELAKECGSSVMKIREANGIEEKPEANQVLIIPVE